jgi:hypothetical protein
MSTTNGKKKINKKFAPINATDRQAKSNFSSSGKSRKKRPLSIKRLVLSVGFIILVTTAGTLAFNIFGNRDNGSASDQVKSVFSGEELKTYTSPGNKFTILMPGIPEVSKSSAKYGDKDIPITEYSRSIENGSKNYNLAVFDYSGVTLEDPKALLETSLNNAIQNTPGAELVETKAGKYGELDAIEGKYKLTQGDETYEAHIRYVIKDSRMYAMILLGADQAKFDEFANSLKFN